MVIHGVQWDTTGTLPFVGDLHAYYYNGRFATRPYVTGRGRVWIDVDGSAPDKCFWRDIEPGNGDPSSFGGWLDRRRAAVGSGGGGYCDRSDLPGMIASAGSHRPWSLWLATLDGTLPDPSALNLPPTVTLVAVQAIPEAMLGFHADESFVVDAAYWQQRAHTG